MKQKLITIVILICLLILAEFAHGQTVCVVQSRSEANVVVYRTNYLSEADLLVYRTNYIIEADNNIGRWFFVDSKHKAEWRVYYTKYKSEADINIMWTNYPTMAGYQPNRRQAKIK